jgi:hypothetical protein
MMKIIVDTEEEKEALIKESYYVHYSDLDSDFCSRLMHIYLNPDRIEVRKE